MAGRILHIFRNTPFGRETLMQTADFAAKIGGRPCVYVPRHPQFLIYLEDDVVTVGLDRSYLHSPETAEEHAREILGGAGLEPAWVEPREFTAPTLPDLPADFEFMCCPRSIADMSSRIGLGYIGPRVRRIVRHAGFPVLIPAARARPIGQIVAFYGGSEQARGATLLAAEIAQRAGLPLWLFTQSSKPRESFAESISPTLAGRGGMPPEERWIFTAGRSLRESLFDVPPDSLLVLGAFGHSAAREALFGSFAEKIQTLMPNPLLLAGPRCTAAQ